MSDSAVSWPAIFAGALVAAAVTVMLFTLGSAFGLAIVSPWPGNGVSPTTFAVSTAIWLVIVQWISSGVGGYLVGRLRTRWQGVHSDEVFFRDSAHGFLAWSLATLVVVVLLATSAGALIGGTARIAGDVVSAGAQGVAGVAAQTMDDADPFSTSYLVDLLVRPSGAAPGAESTPTEPSAAAPSPTPTEPSPTPTEPSTAAPSPSTTPTAPGGAGSTPEAQGDSRAEIGRIVAQGITGQISDEDRAYLAQIIATRTGIPIEEAEQRIDQVVARIEETKTTIQQAADEARKAAAGAAGLTFLSLLIGAFIACVAAIVGGNQRDGLAPWMIRAETTDTTRLR